MLWVNKVDVSLRINNIFLKKTNILKINNEFSVANM
jgi:hypothetical protein